MSRAPADRPGAPDHPASGGADRRKQTLKAVGWSELDQDDAWPLNFIVRPDEPGLGPPTGAELPVLTTPPDWSDQNESPDSTYPDSDWPNSHTSTTPADQFAPTVFGPKLRHAYDGDDDALHADPDSAPASLGQRRSAFANWSFLWLVLLLLLGLAAAAWLWLPHLREGG